VRQEWASAAGPEAGLPLTGPDGLLKHLTKVVLETGEVGIDVLRDASRGLMRSCCRCMPRPGHRRDLRTPAGDLRHPGVGGNRPPDYRAGIPITQPRQ
jgi:hypothetical protein